MKSPARKPCCIRNCRRTVGPDEHSNKCSKHRRDWHRENHPFAYYLGKLKRRASERGIRFEISLAEYTAFAIKTDYASLKGKTSLSLSIDRIENSLWYAIWNIRAISLRDNSRKAYIPFHNGGAMPQNTSDEQRRFDVEYRKQCARIADCVGEIYSKGSSKFWDEFHKRKIALFESVDA